MSRRPGWTPPGWTSEGGIWSPPAVWYVEGVVWCPGCALYLDFCGTPQELQEFIDAHDCTAKGQPQ